MSGGEFSEWAVKGKKDMNRCTRLMIKEKQGSSMDDKSFGIIYTILSFSSGAKKIGAVI